MPLPAFIEQRLDPEISYGSSGGPMFSTSVFAAASGFEQRNMLWSESRAKYDIAYSIRDKATMDVVLAFFFNVRGKAIGFRFKDWADYNVAAQNIGTGNGVLTTYQLVKKYVTGPYTYTRTITKPVTGTVTGVTVGGVPKVETTDFTINYTTGIFTFVVPPANLAAIVVGNIQYDVPVRFDIDELPLVNEAFLIESLSSIPLVEIRTNA